MRATTLSKVAAHDDGVWALAWVPGQPALLTGSVDESVKAWSTAEDKLTLTHTYTGQALGVISLDVDASGGLAVSSSLDSTLRVFGLGEDKSVKHMIERPPSESYRAVFGAVGDGAVQLAIAGGSRGQAVTYRGAGDDPAIEFTLDLPQV